MSKKKLNYQDLLIEIEAISVPVRVFIERRNNVRVSLGKNYVILRIPFLSLSGTQKHVDTAKSWLEELYVEKPELLTRYDLRSLKSKRQLTILGKDTYDINIIEEDRIDGELNVIGSTLNVAIPNHISDYDKRILVRKLLSQIAVKRYKVFVKDRIHFFNTNYFSKTVKGVTLRYNSTNWGSCSTNGKINISTRSLLLPLDVFDYILVHELSHLVEMNHSASFWNVVESVMPNYKKHEIWLKSNGSKLDF